MKNNTFKTVVTLIFVFFDNYRYHAGVIMNRYQ